MEAALYECLRRTDGWWTEDLRVQPVDRPPMEEPVRKEHGAWVFAITQEPAEGYRAAQPLDLYERGYTRLVLATPLADGRYRYTLARRSDLVPGFPIPRFYEALNSAEEAARGAPLVNTWGGASTVGGGPRDGSVLSPEQVAGVIDRVLNPAREG